MSLSGKHILLIVTGGIAAFKALELIRLIQKAGGTCQAILTPAATEFVTPLSVSTLTGRPALTELFDLTQETEIGHIELSRSADLIVVAPATADFLAKMAQGFANDLASTTVLATDTDILAAPAMNVRMYEAAATQRNLKQLHADGVRFVGPDEGEMACGEYGPGRMAEPAAIVGAIENYFAAPANQPLKGKQALVTSGPTREWIDPVRYISNASSGRQGTAIAEALAALGASVTFVTGPAEAAAPAGCRVVRVESAIEMRDAVRRSLPADVAIFAAAVADWRVAVSDKKIKKNAGATPDLDFEENPDILAEISHETRPERPGLVIGFAAETDNVLENAIAKRDRKGCDWLVANDVSAESGILGGIENEVILITANGAENWPRLSKTALGHKLAERVAVALGENKQRTL